MCRKPSQLEIAHFQQTMKGMKASSAMNVSGAYDAVADSVDFNPKDVKVAVKDMEASSAMNVSGAYDAVADSVDPKPKDVKVAM